MYNPTRSRTFSTISGSGDTLKLSCCHGLRLNARQISATVVLEIPCLAANPRVDQWVSAPGADSRYRPAPPLSSHQRCSAPPPAACVTQPFETVGREPSPPLAHRGRMDPLDRRHLPVGGTLGTRQHDPRTQRQRLGRATPANPTLQGLAFESLRSPTVVVGIVQLYP